MIASRSEIKRICPLSNTRVQPCEPRRSIAVINKQTKKLIKFR